jgi:hypothetical protein
MWHDEAALVLNVLHNSFAELLGPLLFAEAAPPLFLWIEKVVSLLLGDGTYALRLVPWLASCASLVLMVPVARKLLHPLAAPWALLLFACSDHLLWHACEAKPYALDVWAATVLLALYAYAESWSAGLRLLSFGLLSSILIFLAYPGCFLCGGLLVALLPTVWQTGRARNWVGYGLVVLVVFASFGLLVAGPVQAQRSSTIAECWTESFPPWHRPWQVPVWIIVSSLEVVRYCCEPTGQILAVAAAVGVARLWRRGQRAWLVLMIVPIVLALLASFGRAYPYGGARVLVYAAPALLLLIAEGITPILYRTATTETKRRWWFVLVRACVVMVLLAPCARAVYHVVAPWPRANSAAAAAYVLTHRAPGENVTGNHWEYAYYFRQLGPAFTFLDGTPHEFGDRLWLVATAGTPQERVKIARVLACEDRCLVTQQEFERTSVFLLARDNRAQQ